jgi:hypothetical protein
MKPMRVSHTHRHQCRRCCRWLHCTATTCRTLLILCAACYVRVYGMDAPPMLRRQRPILPDPSTP